MQNNDLFIILTIILYMVMVIWIGIDCSKKNKTSDDFYLGGRKLGPFVTAMSAEASDMSSWLLMGLPGVALADIAPSAPRQRPERRCRKWGGSAPAWRFPLEFQGDQRLAPVAGPEFPWLRRPGAYTPLSATGSEREQWTKEPAALPGNLAADGRSSFPVCVKRPGLQPESRWAPNNQSWL